MVVCWCVGASTLSCSRDNSDYGLADWRRDADADVLDRCRSELGQQIHQRGDLIGKSRQDVLDMLGDPDHKSSEVMVYRLGPDPSFGIDFWDLRVEFDDEGCVAVTSMETY